MWLLFLCFQDIPPSCAFNVVLIARAVTVNFGLLLMAWIHCLIGITSFWTIWRLHHNGRYGVGGVCLNHWAAFSIEGKYRRHIVAAVVACMKTEGSGAIGKPNLTWSPAAYQPPVKSWSITAPSFTVESPRQLTRFHAGPACWAS